MNRKVDLIKKCKYCNQDLSSLHWRSKLGHLGSCSLNPKRLQGLENMKRKLTQPRNSYTIICKKCFIPYQIMRTENQYNHGNYKEYCSYKCSNSRTQTEDIRKRKSMKLKGRKCRYIIKHSEETKKKMSDSRIKFIKDNPEYVKLLSNKLKERRKLGFNPFPKGSKHKPETIVKIKESLLKTHHTNEFKDKMRMSRLKQVFPTKDTKIEVTIQKALINESIDFEKHYPILGQPDIFIKPNICIFCDGEYWHNYPGGLEKDKRVNHELEKQGYKVLRFWGDKINTNIKECIQKIKLTIAPIA